ncbi:MAG: hypothetical protein ACTHYC_08085 [Sphingobacterium sp.]
MHYWLVCNLAHAQRPAYVLVHGAWGGARQFSAVEKELHEVHRINLTGLGERYHRSRADIDLKRAIADLVNTT